MTSLPKIIGARYRTRDPINIEINLDEATRSSICAAACVAMFNAGARAWDLGEWRRRAADWSLVELLHRASECGVTFRRGGKPWALPASLDHQLTKGGWH
jgi:hypothetical protein